MSDVMQEIEMRRARRGLSERPVPAETVARLMTAATYAPSCANNQPWRFLVATEKQSLEKLHTALSGGNYWAKKAPLLVVVATKLEFDARLSDGRDYALYGCGLATENLLLQACADGLIAHPMAGFDPLAVKEAFAIPEDYVVICLIAVGYPGSAAGLSDKHAAAETDGRSRKDEAEVICYERWSLT